MNSREPLAEDSPPAPVGTGPIFPPLAQSSSGTQLPLFLQLPPEMHLPPGWSATKCFRGNQKTRQLGADGCQEPREGGGLRGRWDSAAAQAPSGPACPLPSPQDSRGSDGWGRGTELTDSVNRAGLGLGQGRGVLAQPECEAHPRLSRTPRPAGLPRGCPAHSQLQPGYVWVLGSGQFRPGECVWDWVGGG
jgi:hypothetical protein